MLEPKQRRWLELMQSDKGRKKLRSTLAHFADFDPAMIVPTPPSQQHPPLIHQLLADSGVPTLCSLISANPDWDGRDMDLHVALKEIVGY